jgi:hypothetical protein
MALSMPRQALRIQGGASAHTAAGRKVFLLLFLQKKKKHLLFLKKKKQKDFWSWRWSCYFAPGWR